MLEVKIKNVPSPLTLMGFTLLLDQHFTCTTVLLSVWGLVCLSAGNGKCHAIKSCSILTTLSCGTDWIKHSALSHIYTDVSIFSAIGNISLHSVCPASYLLILPFPFFHSSDPLSWTILQPIYSFIYLFVLQWLSFWHSDPRFLGLYGSSCSLPHICKHTQIHSQSPPPFSSSLLVRLVLFSPLNLNLGRWVEYCVGSKSFKHKCLIPNTHGPHSNSQIITYSSVDNSLPQCLNKQRFVCYI